MEQNIKTKIKLTGVAIILIGLYSLLRSNIGVLDNEIVWLTSYRFFFEVLVPFLIIVSGFLLFQNKAWERRFAFYILFIDLLDKLDTGIFHTVAYLTLRDIPIPEPTPGYTIVKHNFWPSHIIGLIDLLLIVSIYQIHKNKTITTTST